MQKKKINKLVKSYEAIHKNDTEHGNDIKGYWEWNKLNKNRNQRIDAWKNSR
ncbi:hypothetical protein [Isachenkonia alkalipeptolytica]|uniref:hypothetical protein n=1 Tax=Isachenkonia alkalipeptolytica TaxID=2565777 RepID=UPI00136FF69D|nr:hypothetical protein [Isachenkonia alkalipeptolytica]